MRGYHRRQFLLASGALLVAPLVRAQGSSLPLVGYISIGNADANSHLVTAFRRGLGEAGYVEGKNATIEFQWADGQTDKVPGFAANLVRRNAAVIVATGGPSTWVPVKAATVTIPIVFTGGSDPVKLGLVASLGRPGGNATGITSNSLELIAKRMQLLRELVPTANLISVLTNFQNEMYAKEVMKEFQSGIGAKGPEIHLVNVHSENDFDAAFAQIVHKRAGALLVGPDAFFTARRKQLVALAAKHAIPTSYAFPEFVDVGGLMSYGVNLAEMNRQAGMYAGRILKGTKPGDLPVLQPTVFELALNLKTAKAIGLTIPQSVLVRADRVIE